jgi:hypothetical protein
VTVGLLLYEFHNIRKCRELIREGARLEETLGGGQFRVHPSEPSRGSEASRLHLFAAIFVYVAVIIGWVYVAAVGVRCAFS